MMRLRKKLFKPLKDLADEDSCGCPWQEESINDTIDEISEIIAIYWLRALFIGLISGFILGSIMFGVF